MKAPDMENVEILLVEDNPDDAALTIRTLRKNHLANRLLHVEDGQEALDYLFKPDTALPRLILLDLKMPRVDGIEVLKKLKGDPQRKQIPVVILTSSREERDLIESYHLGVNAYVVKPVDFNQFVSAVTELGMFWLILNQTPKMDG
jgi:two-component system response regulator